MERHENGTSKDKSKNQKLKKYEYYSLNSILGDVFEENKGQKNLRDSSN